MSNYGYSNVNLSNNEASQKLNKIVQNLEIENIQNCMEII